MNSLPFSADMPLEPPSSLQGNAKLVAVDSKLAYFTGRACWDGYPLGGVNQQTAKVHDTPFGDCVIIGNISCDRQRTIALNPTVTQKVLFDDIMRLNRNAMHSIAMITERASDTYAGPTDGEGTLQPESVENTQE